MAVIELNNNTFKNEVLESKGVVMVDFWAPWCAPCRMLSPVVDQVAEETAGVKVGKVNIDEGMDLAVQYGVQSIPCIVVFKDGKEVNRSVGVVPKAKLQQIIENA